MDVAESIDVAAPPAVLQVKRRASTHPSSRNVCPKVNDDDEVKAALKDLIERVEHSVAAVGDDEYEKMIEGYNIYDESPEVFEVTRRLKQLTYVEEEVCWLLKKDGVTEEDERVKAMKKTINSLKASIVALINPGYKRLAKLSESLGSGTVEPPTEHQIECAKWGRALAIGRSGLSITQEMQMCVSA